MEARTMKGAAQAANKANKLTPTAKAALLATIDKSSNEEVLRCIAKLNTDIDALRAAKPAGYLDRVKYLHAVRMVLTREMGAR